jgi:hypothetical protein
VALNTIKEKTLTLNVYHSLTSYGVSSFNLSFILDCPIICKKFDSSSHVEQVLLTLPEHLNSSLLLMGFTVQDE